MENTIKEIWGGAECTASLNNGGLSMDAATAQCQSNGAGNTAQIKFCRDVLMDHERMEKKAATDECQKWWNDSVGSAMQQEKAADAAADTSKCLPYLWQDPTGWCKENGDLNDRVKASCASSMWSRSNKASLAKNAGFSKKDLMVAAKGAKAYNEVKANADKGNTGRGMMSSANEKLLGKLKFGNCEGSQVADEMQANIKCYLETQKPCPAADE